MKSHAASAYPDRSLCGRVFRREFGFTNQPTCLACKRMLAELESFDRANKAESTSAEVEK